MGDAALLRAPPIVPAPPPRGQMDAPQVSRRHGPHRHRRRDRPGAARGRAQAGPPDAWGCWASGRRGAPRLPLCAQAIRPGCRRRRRRRRRSCSAALRCDAPHAPARRNRARNLSACARSMRTARVPTWPQQAGGGGGAADQRRRRLRLGVVTPQAPVEQLGGGRGRRVKEGARGHVQALRLGRAAGLRRGVHVGLAIAGATAPRQLLLLQAAAQRVRLCLCHLLLVARPAPTPVRVGGMHANRGRGSGTVCDHDNTHVSHCSRYCCASCCASCRASCARLSCAAIPRTLEEGCVAPPDMDDAAQQAGAPCSSQRGGCPQARGLGRTPLCDCGDITTIAMISPSPPPPLPPPLSVIATTHPITPLARAWVTGCPPPSARSWCAAPPEATTTTTSSCCRSSHPCAPPAWPSPAPACWR
jgi:hypothetical protein